MARLPSQSMQDKIKKRKTELQNLRMGPGGAKYKASIGFKTIDEQIQEEFGVKKVKVTGADRVAMMYGGTVNPNKREAMDLIEHNRKTGRNSLPQRYIKQGRR
jgi:hypothetical protein